MSSVAPDFYTVLRRRVRRYFETTRQSAQGGQPLWLKTGLLLGSCATSWTLLLFWASTPWQGASLSLALGLSMAGIGFNVQHDASHGAFSRSRRVNRFMAATLDLMGGSSYVWRFKHNLLHHSQPNVVGVDDDIDLGPLARLAPGQPLHGAYRLQHFYLWFLYALLAFKWQWFDDYAMVLKGRVGSRRVARPRGTELVVFVVGKLAFVGWSLLIPALLHSLSAVLAFHTLAALTLGLTMSAVFQVAHCVPEAWLEVAAAGRPWAVHQVEAAVDFSPRNRLLRWYIGGLNFQIEHHLFPWISHVHYPALAPMVEATCRQFGLRYASHRTFFAALHAHQSWLKRMGRPEREGADTAAMVARASTGKAGGEHSDDPIGPLDGL